MQSSMWQVYPSLLLGKGIQKQKIKTDFSYSRVIETTKHKPQTNWQLLSIAKILFHHSKIQIHFIVINKCIR
jgi:hypothetical protein